MEGSQHRWKQSVPRNNSLADRTNELWLSEKFGWKTWSFAANVSVNCCCFCSRAAHYSSDKPSAVPTQLPRQYTLAQGLAVYIKDGVQSWKSCDARSKRDDGSSSSRSSGNIKCWHNTFLDLTKTAQTEGMVRVQTFSTWARPSKNVFIITSTDSLPSISVSWKRRRLRPRAAFLKNHKKFISSLDGK